MEPEPETLRQVLRSLHARLEASAKRVRTPKEQAMIRKLGSELNYMKPGNPRAVLSTFTFAQLKERHPEDHEYFLRLAASAERLLASRKK